MSLQYWDIVALNIAGTSEGKKSFTHHLIRLMCGTCDHPTINIVNNL